jgi:hypothetical protein
MAEEAPTPAQLRALAARLAEPAGGLQDAYTSLAKSEDKDVRRLRYGIDEDGRTVLGIASELQSRAENLARVRMRAHRRRPVGGAKWVPVPATAGVAPAARAGAGCRDAAGAGTGIGRLALLRAGCSAPAPATIRPISGVCSVLDTPPGIRWRRWRSAPMGGEG